MYSLKKSIKRNVNVAILLISRGQKVNQLKVGNSDQISCVDKIRDPVLSVQRWLHQAQPGPTCNKHYQSKETFYSI